MTVPPERPARASGEGRLLRPSGSRSGAAARAERLADPLLRRFGAGDEQALAELYDRWGPAVLALASRILQDPDEAEDVVEETFWQAWRQREGYDASRGAISTWLLMIGRSRALDRRRARGRRREQPMDDGTPVARSASDPSRDAELAERSRRVRAQLAELPPEQREAIELAYFGGLTQTEIAAQTAQPLGTVKTRVRLALQKLRAGLQPLGEG